MTGPTESGARGEQNAAHKAGVGNRKDSVKLSATPFERSTLVNPREAQLIVTKGVSGWEGIRTPGGLSPTTVFKTVALDHSATHPKYSLASTYNYL
jgi:hypothetical protein